MISRRAHPEHAPRDELHLRPKREARRPDAADHDVGRLARPAAWEGDQDDHLLGHEPRAPRADGHLGQHLHDRGRVPRSMPLITSVCDPLRKTTTLSSEPVSTSVFWSPAAIIRTAAKTKTTSAIPGP